MRGGAGWWLEGVRQSNGMLVTRACAGFSVAYLGVRGEEVGGVG